jgi:hypothetical protein
MKGHQADAQGHQNDQMKVKLAVAKDIEKYKKKGLPAYPTCEDI